MVLIRLGIGFRIFCYILGAAWLQRMIKLIIVATWPIIEEHFVKLLRKVAKYELFVKFGKRYTFSKLYDHLYVGYYVNFQNFGSSEHGLGSKDQRSLGMQMKMFRNNRASS